MSQRSKPKQQVKLKDKKINENYLERIKAGSQKTQSIFN